MVLTFILPRAGLASAPARLVPPAGVEPATPALGTNLAPCFVARNRASSVVTIGELEVGWAGGWSAQAHGPPGGSSPLLPGPARQVRFLT